VRYIAALSLAVVSFATTASQAFASNPLAAGAAAPATVAPGRSTLLTVAVTPGTAPESTGLFVSCNLSSIGGSFTQLFADDGSGGDAQGGDLVFSYRATVSPTAALGPRSLSCIASDAQSRVAVTQIALAVDALPNQPPTVDAGGPYTLDEGQSASLAAIGLDPEGDALAFAWDLDGDAVFETPGQSTSVTVDDGPATRHVAVRASDSLGAASTAQATIDIANVAPKATLQAPKDAAPGSTFSLGLVNPTDPSAADTTAGFTYSFDCGAGYSPWGDAASTPCTAGTANAAVGARIRDKDGGVTEYHATVATAATFDRLCSLTRRLSRKPHVADALCKKLRHAERAKSRRKRRSHLEAYRNQVRAQMGTRRRSAFTPQDGSTLLRYSRLLG
jgi:hypothetical protein